MPHLRRPPRRPHQPAAGGSRGVGTSPNSRPSPDAPRCHPASPAQTAPTRRTDRHAARCRHATARPELHRTRSGGPHIVDGSVRVADGFGRCRPCRAWAGAGADGRSRPLAAVRCRRLGSGDRPPPGHDRTRQLVARSLGGHARNRDGDLHRETRRAPPGTGAMMASTCVAGNRPSNEVVSRRT